MAIQFFSYVPLVEEAKRVSQEHIEKVWENILQKNSEEETLAQ